MVGSILDGFSKFGLFVGIIIACWTVWFEHTHEKEHKQYRAERPLEIEEKYGANNTVKPFKHSLLEYANWYSRLSTLEKAGWLIIACPILGIIVSGLVLFVLVKLILGFALKILTLGRC